MAFVTCAMENDVAEGEECDQRHVIGNEHRADEGYINKGNSCKTEIFRKADDFFSAHIEEVDSLQRADNCKSAEEAGECAIVEVAEVFGIGCNDK